MEVGIRELRDHLSKYVERVRSGEEITVTDHGSPVAKLVPIGEQSTFDRLVAEGVITPASKPKTPLVGPAIRTKGTVSDLVIDDRR